MTSRSGVRPRAHRSRRRVPSRRCSSARTSVVAATLPRHSRRRRHRTDGSVTGDRDGRSLPTVQINGVVWDTLIVGNRVYATGQFSRRVPRRGGRCERNAAIEHPRLRPHDREPDHVVGADRSTRKDVKLAASSDGSTVYVGGDFTQVSGQSRLRIAAIDAQTGACGPGIPARTRGSTPSPWQRHDYFGGDFSTVGTSRPDSSPARLAAANATTGAILPWNPSATCSSRRWSSTRQRPRHRRRVLQHAERHARRSAWVRSTASRGASPHGR